MTSISNTTLHVNNKPYFYPQHAHSHGFLADSQLALSKLMMWHILNIHIWYESSYVKLYMRTRSFFLQAKIQHGMFNVFILLVCINHDNICYSLSTSATLCSPYFVCHIFCLFQTKGTSSFGKRHNKTHTLCVRCNRSAYHIQKKVCASCRYPAARKRKCECI